jgi:hypothetical protein
MQIELRDINSITPYEKNPRLNDDAVDEIWRAVPGYEGLYEVSSRGRVRRSNHSRAAPAGYVLKPRTTRDGYLVYYLSKHSRYWYARAHRLVALAFLGPPPFPKAHVAHSDGNRRNNQLCNLRWVTGKQNEADKKLHGTDRGAAPGEGHHMARLTKEQVSEMRRLAASGMPFKTVAAQMGIPKVTAYDAIVGTTWKSITEPPPVGRSRRITI